MYGITDEGLREMRLRWEEAFREPIQPVAVDLAIYHAELFPAELVDALLQDRRDAAIAEQATLERLYATAEPHLSEWERLGFRHRLLRVNAELAWLEETLQSAEPGRQ